MKSEKAASAATAKPCPIPLTVDVPAALIDDTIDTLKNVDRILRDELDVRVDSISANGRLLGPDDEMTAFDHRNIAEVAAASKGVRDLIGEMKSIKKAAMKSSRRMIADLTTPFIITGIGDVAVVDSQDVIRNMVVGADVAALLERANAAARAGDTTRAAILRTRALFLDDRLTLDEAFAAPRGTDPEGEASARLAKRDAARGRKHRSF